MLMYRICYTQTIQTAFIYGIYGDECGVYISIGYISLSEVLYYVSALLYSKLEEIGVDTGMALVYICYMYIYAICIYRFLYTRLYTDCIQVGAIYMYVASYISSYTPVYPIYTIYRRFLLKSYASDIIQVQSFLFILSELYIYKLLVYIACLIYDLLYTPYKEQITASAFPKAATLSWKHNRYCVIRNRSRVSIVIRKRLPLGRDS